MGTGRICDVREGGLYPFFAASRGYRFAEERRKCMVDSHRDCKELRVRNANQVLFPIVEKGQFDIGETVYAESGSFH